MEEFTTTEKKRLTSEGSDVLRDVFFRQKITHPNSEQAKEIVERIRNIPGLEWYTVDRMRNWFTNQRSNTKRITDLQKTKSGATTRVQEGSSKLTIKIPNAGADLSSNPSPAVPTLPKLKQKSSGKHRVMLPGYPSIQAKHEEQLSVLFDSCPTHPPQKLIETWAKLLKATPQDVSNWMEAKARQKEEEANDMISDFPGPSEARAVPMDQSESEDEPLMMNPGSTLANGNSTPGTPTKLHPTINPNLKPSKSFVTPSLPAVASPPHLSPRDQLLLAIHKGCAGPSPPLKTVESLSQFNGLFAQYETLMAGFIKDVETGKLETRGWNLKFH